VPVIVLLREGNCCAIHCLRSNQRSVAPACKYLLPSVNILHVAEIRKNVLFLLRMVILDRAEAWKTRKPFEVLQKTLRNP
jgi:hypothetical protein